jgi:hypothetical protein
MMKANSKTAIYLLIAAILVWLLYSQMNPGAKKVSTSAPDVMGYAREEYEMGSDGGAGSEMGSRMGVKNEEADLGSIDLSNDYLAPYEADAAPDCQGSECAMNSGVGLASSLLPREVAKNDDFGKFVPEEVLKGQNFLDPRMQIGFPETIGGTLRNANQQIRAEPPNPKQPFMWNNSTIVPDMMQRPLFT